MPKTNSVIFIGCSQIKTLEGVPQHISGEFICAGTAIESLKGAPAYVGRDFDCSNTKITSLKGMPSMLSNNLYLEANCELRSLIGAPSAVGGRVYIDDDNALSKRAINDYLAYLKHPTPEHTDDTGHYLP